MEMYQAFATFMRGMKMNKATWDSLSPEAKRIWDQLQQRDKDIILRSRPGMSPRNTRSTPQGSPSAEQPSPLPSARQSPPNRQHVAFHEFPNHLPSINQQYETNFLERGRYDVSNVTHQPGNAPVALSNDTFYTPKPSKECNISMSLLLLGPLNMHEGNDQIEDGRRGANK